MGSERYWVGRGSPRWQDRRNWSRSSGGLPGANPPGRGELAILDELSGGGDVDLFGMACGMRVSKFGGTLTSPSGQRIDFAKPAESDDAPKISRAIRAALTDRKVSWRQAVRDGLAAVAELRRRLVLVPVVAGGTAITAAAGGGNFTANGTWVGGVAPTAADDAILANTSGNVTINAGSVCRSLSCTGYTGTLTHTAAVTFTIGDATAGAGNVALKLVAGMTYTLGDAATSAIAFASTSATQQTVATGGKSLGNVTFGSGASPPSYLLSDGLTVATTATITHSRGTFNTNGQACSWGLFVCNSGFTRTLTLGASAITIKGSANAVSTNSTVGLTITANTATFTFTSGNAVWFTTGINLQGASVVMNGGGSMSISGASGTFQCVNLTITGTAVKTDIFSMACGQFTMTGTLTLTGNSVTNRLAMISNSFGTSRTLSAAAVSLTNVDFQDSACIGTAAPFTGSSLGDLQGNSGITFTVAATQTWQGTVSGSWSNAAKWTSRVPLPQDDVIIASAFSAGQTITVDMPRPCRNIDFTGTTGAPTLLMSAVVTMYGNVTMATGVLCATTFTVAGRGAQTFTSAAVAFGGSITFAGFGGTYTLQDNLSVRAGGSNSIGFLVTSGTVNANGKNVNTSAVQVNAAGSLQMGTGTFTLNGTGTIVIWSVVTGSTLTASTSTINIVSTDSAVTKTFAGGDKTYNAVTHTATGSAALTITGTNTFATLDLECTTARTITIPSNVTQTITGTLTILGASGQNLSIVSSTPGTKASLVVQKSPYITNPFVTPSTDVRIVGRRRRSGVTIQDPAMA